MCGINNKENQKNSRGLCVKNKEFKLSMLFTRIIYLNSFFDFRFKQYFCIYIIQTRICNVNVTSRNYFCNLALSLWKEEITYETN